MTADSSASGSANSDNYKTNTTTTAVGADGTILTVESPKDYKICDVLGGLDVTRLISTNARNFFASAIDDVELLREYLVETTRYSNRTSDFATLEAMSHSLDWEARGLSPNTTTLDANLGYTDDRKDRRIDRFVGLTNEPLVGTKETDFFMMDGLSPLFPWVVDRRSKPDSQWLDHFAGRSQGDTKEPFAFDVLYSGAWLISYGDSLLYYPPLTVYSHPLTFGDRVGTNWNSHDAPFSTPNFPENNPDRIAFFSKPYPDLAVPGLSLVSAIAPVYYKGSFMGYDYPDTYVASLGVDIATSSVSSFLDVLQDSLAPGSFGMLVDAELSTIVISEEVVRRIYPERTGFEESRVSYNKDGSIAVDRRNQTYLPSDTILQDLTELSNGDWKALQEEISQSPKGAREYTTFNLTLTGETEPVEYYVMYERWQFVADWTLLVFAPVQQVRQAIDVYLTTADSDDEDLTRPTTATLVDLEGERGSTLWGHGTLVNNGNLDVILRIPMDKVPSWVQLTEGYNDGPNMVNEESFKLRAGEHLQVGFSVATADLDVGTQSSFLVFDVKDAFYPDCFFRQELSLPISVRVNEIPCDGVNQIYDNTQEACVCDSSSVEIVGFCLDHLVIAVCVFVPVLLVGILAFWLYSRHKRQVANSLWKIDKSELKFEDEEDTSRSSILVVSEGSFGEQVVLANYRGTQVAVKYFRTSRGGGLRRSSLVGRRTGRRPSMTSNLDSDPSEAHIMEAGMLLQEQHPARRDDPKARQLTASTSGRALKKAPKKADFAKEMRLLSSLKHPNIATVMGAVCDNKSPMKAIVLEHFENGSLSDCLQNAIELDGEIITSILIDISRGLQFLHYHKPNALHHGNLKAENVLLDSNFRAKLSDFGLTIPDRQMYGYMGSPAWMAPERLRRETDATAASDIYSLGCCLYEIYARREPFYGEDLPLAIQEVCNPQINRRPPKPVAMPPPVAVLMQDCLVANAEERPSLEEITSRLKRFKATDVDPVGMVKKVPPGKANFDLLLKLFPRHIAEALRDGRPIEPENHSSVSIFFSDIVSFTTISSSIEPHKVTNMLHRLFYRMDNLADQHGLYKVETIGDAWFGCTNCVKKQPNSHAKNIAQFALDSMQAASETLIDLDDPDRGCVQIRVGLHSGPVVANVIGSTSPHFTLFGDSVNTASRMESNSLPGRIQSTEAFFKLLQKQAPDMQTTRRGKIPIKGKGEMTTYWIGLDTTEAIAQNLKSGAAPVTAPTKSATPREEAPAQEQAPAFTHKMPKAYMHGAVADVPVTEVEC